MAILRLRPTNPTFKTSYNRSEQPMPKPRSMATKVEKTTKARKVERQTMLNLMLNHVDSEHLKPQLNQNKLDQQDSQVLRLKLNLLQFDQFYFKKDLKKGRFDSLKSALMRSVEQLRREDRGVEQPKPESPFSRLLSQVPPTSPTFNESRMQEWLNGDVECATASIARVSRAVVPAAMRINSRYSTEAACQYARMEDVEINDRPMSYASNPNVAFEDDIYIIPSSARMPSCVFEVMRLQAFLEQEEAALPTESREVEDDEAIVRKYSIDLSWS